VPVTDGPWLDLIGRGVRNFTKAMRSGFSSSGRHLGSSSPYLVAPPVVTVLLSCWSHSSLNKHLNPRGVRRSLVSAIPWRCFPTARNLDPSSRRIRSYFLLVSQRTVGPPESFACMKFTTPVSMHICVRSVLGELREIRGVGSGKISTPGTDIIHFQKTLRKCNS
jgi:hypothetical protein